MFLKGTSFHFMNNKFRFDGDFFVRNLDASVERSTRRGKGPRKTRYIQYCTWAHALMVRIHSCWAFTLHRLPILWKASAQPGEVNILHFSFQKKDVGPEDAEYAFPEAVLKYIRNIAPGDVKGEIREVCLSSIYSLQYFLNQILLCWKLCWSGNNYVEFLIFVTGCF